MRPAVRPSMELEVRMPAGSRTDTGNNFGAQVLRRRANEHAIIVNPLAHLTDEELQADVVPFAVCAGVSAKKVLRGARVAKDIRTYYAIACGDVSPTASGPAAAEFVPAPIPAPISAPVLTPGPFDRKRQQQPPRPSMTAQQMVDLTDEELAALKREYQRPYSERGTILTILTVSIAAFLQGYVQSSINGASLYLISKNNNNGWELGAANASPFLAAALLGCPLALPVNHYLGRRGAIALAAVAIMASSLGAVWCGDNWVNLFGVRILNGIGMGIKAVSTPILVSESTVGFWRGSSLLAWQLWVAFGIMMGFAFNLIFFAKANDSTAFALTQGSPVVPALALLVAVYFCPESPRYLLRPPHPRIAEAGKVLLKLRNTELQALRDLYVIHKSIEQERYFRHGNESLGETAMNAVPAGRQRWWETVLGFFGQYRDLATQRRLRNALISSSAVALSQQLCGINILAFYSGTLFKGVGAATMDAMKYSLGYGAINFAFGLPAIKTIDVLGRRTWLLMTLLPMAALMGAAAASFHIPDDNTRVGVVAFWLFLFAVVYSPGMGPIPFTLASESFPLSHREAGASFAVGTNLLFAGFLILFFPTINSDPKRMGAGALGLFAGLNLLAFVVVFLLVEETARRSLEDLDQVFAVEKRTFVWHQLSKTLPWFWQRWVLRRHGVSRHAPSLYQDYIMGIGELNGGGGGGGGVYGGGRELEEEEEEAMETDGESSGRESSGGSGSGQDVETGRATEERRWER